MDSDVIYYGSCIFFKFEKSFLSSSGFLDNSLSLSNSDPLRAVFRIVPQGIYTVQDTLLKASQKAKTQKTVKPLKRSKSNKNFNHPKDQSSGYNPVQFKSEYIYPQSSLESNRPINEFEIQYNQHKTNLEGEISTNLSTSLSYKSQPVTFGSQIQLQHWYSKKFLTLSEEKHDKHRDKLKMYLSDFGSKNSSFCINSAFKYQEEGSAYIRHKSKVVLATELKDCEKPVFCDSLEESHEIIGSLENKLAFTIFLFNHDSNNITKICCGDFVQLIHSEENSCFTAVRNLYDRSIVEPRFSLNLKNGNSIWVIENSKAKIQDEEDPEAGDVIKGGEVLTGSSYTIKNLSSGLYLISESVQDAKKLAFSQNRNESKWKIEHDKQGEPVESERFYRIVLDDEELDQGEESEKKNCTLAAEVDTSINGDDKYLPTLLNDELNVSYFRIKKSNDYFLSTTLFLVTSQEFLNNFLAVIKEFIEKQDSDYKQSFTMLEKCLKEIKHFCLNKLPKLISVDVPEGQIDKLKQNTLRDLKLISTLTDILKFFCNFKAKSIRNEALQASFACELDKTFKKIFSLIAVVCQDNQENQEEAFEHVETYCKYIETVPSSNNFLISLFQNNERLLYRLASHTSSERNILINSYINALKVSLK